MENKNKDKKERYKQAFKIVTGIINKADPINLIALKCPADEYEPEVARILPGLQSCTNQNDVHKLIYKVFCDMFDDNMAGNISQYQKAAKEIFERVIKGKLL